jgi:tRNA(Phe) wybutosine-synthesizing methylase Tyw3
MHSFAHSLTEWCAAPTGFRETHRIIAKTPTKITIKIDCRSDLDHLLVTPLHRTITFVQMDHVALLVRQDLHLDVTRLQETIVASE